MIIHVFNVFPKTHDFLSPLGRPGGPAGAPWRTRAVQRTASPWRDRDGCGLVAAGGLPELVVKETSKECVCWIGESFSMSLMIGTMACFQPQKHAFPVY